MKNKRKTVPLYTIGKKEIAAAVRVLKKGPLSGFLGTAEPEFFGGPVVKRFERKFAKKFKVKHAVSFNSATTALHGAIAALGIGPGDEVIVSPYTMSASATAVLMNGAVPIFADIDDTTFCLEPQSVEGRVSKRTKAIMVTNLFGHSPDFAGLIKVARKRGLKIIEDNAQAAGAKWRGRYTGTVGDIGVFSFNVHKIIQSGEGGVLVTNNSRYALRAQLSRNHGESVVPGLPRYDAGPIFGSNYRMTEVIAAIAEAQLDRLEYLVKKRVKLAERLTRQIQGIPGLIPPSVPQDEVCVYYDYTIVIKEKELGISREELIQKLRKRGFPVGGGYVKPLYLLPVFQKKQAFNKTHFPFDYNGMNPGYHKGLCPVAERLHERELFSTSICQPPYTSKDIDEFARAIKEILL